MEPLLPTQRKRRPSLRQLLDAIVSICRTGCHWPNLPACFPPWPAVYCYVARWRAAGTSERLRHASNRADRLAQGRRPTPSLALVFGASWCTQPMATTAAARPCCLTEATAD